MLLIYFFQTVTFDFPSSSAKLSMDVRWRYVVLVASLKCVYSNVRHIGVIYTTCWCTFTPMLNILGHLFSMDWCDDLS